MGPGFHGYDIIFKVIKAGMDLRVNIVLPRPVTGPELITSYHTTQKSRLFASIPFDIIQRVIVIIWK